ncbi:putative ATP-dependent RNA helicase DDX20 [Araneus ventricosus]|uniref:Putative ATP-dependent RNA helicase DDX20 n=1 Tax=Araneus ventricosus TaxID=182803 RepID=A0A4Y2CKC6_ARAVE|nr:putative ATP-dependent RNA helicase DDX20 [Araneus ventricosus]
MTDSICATEVNENVDLSEPMNSDSDAEIDSETPIETVTFSDALHGMTHYYYIVPVNFLPFLSYRRKLEVLKNVLINAKFSQCVIFCNSVHRVQPLCIDIQVWGFSVVSMSKAKDQVERLQAVERLKTNQCKVLVSTDVSSRGLDAENVDLVINFDMPSSCRAYLHRCGRAGRYGAKCASITFLLRNQTDEFDKIESEGHFDSYALPEPIPKELNRDINPSAVPSMPCNLKTGCNSKEDFQASSTEFSQNAIINLEKTTAGEGCSLLSANKIEEQTVDLETVNATHLMGDQMIKLENECAEDHQDTAKKNENGEACLLLSYEENTELPDCLKINTEKQPEIFNEEYESKNCEQSSCKTAHAPYSNEAIGECASVTGSSECKSLPLNDDLESWIISSDRKTSEIETDTGSEYFTLKIKSTSKMPEEYGLHKAFDKMHLEREENCSKKVAKLPQVTRNKKKSFKNMHKKKSAKSLDHYKSPSKSPERQVMFCGLESTSSEFDANQSCTKFYSGYPDNHMVKKKVKKTRKMHSTRGKYRDTFDHLSQECNFNVQRNPRPCHDSSQYCCHFPNNYCQPSFLLHREIFYKQWMFINNFSHFLSYYVKS